MSGCGKHELEFAQTEASHYLYTYIYIPTRIHLLEEHPCIQSKLWHRGCWSLSADPLRRPKTLKLTSVLPAKLKVDQDDVWNRAHDAPQDCWDWNWWFGKASVP